ncbi:MAG: hypothetical protein U0X39_13885 [Bacteroidales bacterium]
MANVRQLKKDIDNLLLEVVSDGFLVSALHPERDPEEVNDIIEDAVKLRNDLISRVNNYKVGDDALPAGKHFRAVKEDLRTGVVELCKRLSSVSKAKK